MKIELKRIESTPLRTHGQLAIDGQPLCDTLELPWRDNAQLVSCIPAGTYDVRLRYSPKFARILPQIMLVPGRSNILIHAANSVNADGNAAQHNEHDELAGCIAPGEREGSAIRRSRHWEDRLVALLKEAEAGGQAITITVVNCAP